MNCYNESPAECPFSNYRSKLLLEYLKYWGCRKKNVGNEEEANDGS